MTSTRGARVLAYATFVAVVAIIVGVITLTSRTTAVADGNRIQACRSSYNADMVTAQDRVDEARDAVDDARDRVDQAQADSGNLVLLGLAATARGDDASLFSLADSTPAALAAIAAARHQQDIAQQAKVAARATKTRAVMAYHDAAARSAEDPDAFIEACNKEGRI